MDGVRGYWNGERLLSKKGKEIINCPKWFTEKLPSTTSLDGELWMERGNSHTQRTVVLKSSSNDSDWSRIGYYIYDVPQEEVMKIEWEL